jgi:hypothetical protein
MASTDTSDQQAFTKTARAKQASRDAKIPAEWRLPELYLSSLSAAAAPISLPTTQSLGTLAPLTPNKNVPVINVSNAPVECGLLTQQEAQIVALDATEIVERLHTGKLSCVQVTTAFCKSASVCHQLVSSSSRNLIEPF